MFLDQLMSAFRDKPILSNDNYISSVNPGLTVPIVHNPGLSVRSQEISWKCDFKQVLEIVHIITSSII